ncbi:unnamed protein product [Allacma fusca]|uniref:Uncharacterized protein n=1 Tax=Allacma fusca TaxID=39272 RepID=A0A8J2KCN1_9HEXA|nr:unnamed protein product [Allacma fusca]
MSGKIHPLLIPAVVLVIVPLFIFAVEEPYCKKSFECKNGSAILCSYWVCDGVKDCHDGSDEEPQMCSLQNGGSLCDNGATWYPSHFKCDGFADCYDLSDEENECCHCTGFYCVTHPRQCISYKEYACDKYPDCLDKTDEDNCPCTATEFQCEYDKTCIPNYWVCDGEDDCTQGDDEDGCPATALKGGIIADVLVSDKKIKQNEKKLIRESREGQSQKVSKRLAKTSRLWQK